MNILGIRVDPVTQEQAVARILEHVSQKQKAMVFTVNPEIIMAAQQDGQFKDLLNRADLSLADGIGVLWAANFYHHVSGAKSKNPINLWLAALIIGFRTLVSAKYRVKTLPQQVSGSNINLDLAQQKAASLFLLGEKEGIAERAAQQLRQMYPSVRIAGTFAGDGSPDGDTETQARLASNPSDIVLVAYGAPKQEKWLERNLNAIPAWVGMGVGGTFRFLAGDIRRAPRWVQRAGLEWLFRLILEPWRWHRQLALPRFVAAVVRDAALAEARRTKD
jgi:N-acetylglucosaminyldiphosphoundecaprenol N-acetyl-beta-D-mannosaminyltransferase